MNLKTINPNELEFWERNYNLHPGEQVEILGEGLVRAAQAANLTELEVNDMSHLTEAQALALMVHDNESAKKSQADPIRLAAALGEAAPVPAVSEDDLAQILAQAMLAEQVAQELSGNGQAKRTERMLGDRAKQIKPVLYVDELVDFEQAILATGLKNRGQAVIEICRTYLGRMGGKQGTEGQ